MVLSDRRAHVVYHRQTYPAKRLWTTSVDGVQAAGRGEYFPSMAANNGFLEPSSAINWHLRVAFTFTSTLLEPDDEVERARVVIFILRHVFHIAQHKRSRSDQMCV